MSGQTDRVLQKYYLCFRLPEMMVPYMKAISDATGYTFIKFLFRWRGSIYKSLFIELCCYMLCYYTFKYFLSLSYPSATVSSTTPSWPRT